MFLVLAGTHEGRRAAKEMKSVGPVLATAATEYGGRLLADSGVEVVVERMDAARIVELGRKRDVRMIVDATHPFAAEISRQAIDAAGRLNAEYIRLEREKVDPDTFGCRITAVDNFKEAAAAARSFHRVFLAVGSSHLEEMLEILDPKEERVIARMLPDAEYVGRARELGLELAQIVAMQGPFSRELNRALLAHYGADVLVTKASGKTGGLDTKLQAASDLDLEVVLIKRPKIHYPCVLESLAEFRLCMEKKLGITFG